MNTQQIQGMVAKIKEFLKEQRLEFTRGLLNKNLKTVKMIAGLLTCHCRLNRHMYKIHRTSRKCYLQIPHKGERNFS